MDECSDALQELYEYLDGELDDSRRSSIARHLSACGECFEMFDFQAELKAVISQRCRDKVPEGLRERLGALIDEDVAT